MTGNELDLLRAVLGDTAEPGIVCMVGAGGKKTAINRLAAAFADRWPTARIAITATVFTAPPARALLDARAVDADPLAAIERLRDARRVGYHTPSHKPGRLGGVSPDVIGRIHREGGFAVTFVKADGARMRALKAPQPGEPALPDATDLVVHLSSAAALGAAFDDRTVHRGERFAALTGAIPGQPLTPEHLSRLLAHPEGAAHAAKSLPLVPIINQVDTDERRTAARRAAEIAVAATDRFDRVLLTALTAEKPLVDMVQRNL